MIKHTSWLLTFIFLALILLLCCFFFFSSTSRTVDFGGTVDIVRVDDESGHVYVTATQDLNDFTCEIQIKQHVRCQNVEGDSVDPSTLKAGDRIALNFRKEPKEVDGIYKAVAKSPVKIYPYT